MKRTLLKFSLLIIVSIIAFSTKSYSLNNQVWDLGCQQLVDLKQITFVDGNKDNHYETIISTYCDLTTGLDFSETSPILYPIEATKGIPINDVPDPVNPLNPFKDLKYKGKKPPKPIKLSFYSDPNKTVLIYTLDWMEGNPAVVYTQFVPYTTDVQNPEENSVMVTPNPAQGDVNVTLNGNASSYKLFNQSGALMLSSNTQICGSFTFNVDDLASGVYYLQILTGTQTIVKPVYVVK